MSDPLTVTFCAWTRVGARSKLLRSARAAGATFAVYVMLIFHLQSTLAVPPRDGAAPPRAGQELKAECDAKMTATGRFSPC